MFSPSEIKDKQFKTGLGYDKKDVEQFLHELSSDYSALFNENEDLKKQLKDVKESLSNYKAIEKTLQKALILAEKTAQDTRATALREAEAIEKDAKTKARQILSDSQKQLELLEHKAINIVQQYDLFKIHFENLLRAQLELINSKSFSLNTENFTYHENQNPPAEPAEDPADEENPEQLHLDLSGADVKSYQTEDGFEFMAADQ